MTVIKLLNKDPNEVMDIVRSMRANGMVQGKDFDFAYYQSRWDEMIGEIPKTVEFRFYEEKLATWFALRWGQ
jgi:hypothetical protein